MVKRGDILKKFTVSEVGVLIESFDNKLQLVAEGLADLSAKVDCKLDTLEPMVRKNADNIDFVLIELRSIRKTQDEHSGELKEIKDRVSVVETKA